MNMKRYGLIGYPLKHSFSRKYFTDKFREEKIDAVYDNYPLNTIDELPGIIEKFPDLAGLNVTLPYKLHVMKYLDDIDKKALKAGAVNVIVINRKGQRNILKGHNTDIEGFVQSLRPVITGEVKKAIVLGTGGASKAVQAGLDEIGIEYSVVSRHKTKGELTYSELTGDIIKNCQLIINTTPLGMFPDTETAPDIPYDSLTANCILYDLVYNPEKTLFLKIGQTKGCRIMNGMEMLLIQAEKAWELWQK